MHLFLSTVLLRTWPLMGEVASCCCTWIPTGLWWNKPSLVCLHHDDKGNVASVGAQLFLGGGPENSSINGVLNCLLNSSVLSVVINLPLFLSRSSRPKHSCWSTSGHRSWTGRRWSTSSCCYPAEDHLVLCILREWEAVLVELAPFGILAFKVQNLKLCCSFWTASFTHSADLN
jgi:hypothetical protein